MNRISQNTLNAAIGTGEAKQAKQALANISKKGGANEAKQASSDIHKNRMDEQSLYIV
jgi:hypothetical protein